MPIVLRGGGLLRDLVADGPGGGQVVALLSHAPRSDALRRARRRSPRRQLPRWPSREERRYARALIARIGELEAAVLDEIKPAASLVLDGRQDGGIGANLIRAIDKVRLRFVEGEPPREVVESTARQLDLFAAREVERVTGRIPPVGANVATARASGVLDDWIAEQASLIRTIDARYFDEVEAAVREAVSSGTSTRDLVKRIEERAPRSSDAPGPRVSARYNAERIARDQVGTLNSKITAARYRDSGIRRYRWATSADERVRPSHWAQEGKIFDLGGPGAVGIGAYGRSVHPGEDINCRCRMIPIIDDEDAVERPPTPEAVERRRPRPRTKAGRVARRAVASAVETAGAAWRRMQRTWVLGSRRKAAVELKKAAIAEFGLEGVPYSRREYKIDPAQVAKSRAAVREQYRATQAALRDGGKAGTVRLYRGLKTNVTTPGAIESWTSDPAIARKFAGRNGPIIVEDVPVSRLLAWHAGPGWKDGKFGAQSEYLVLSDDPRKRKRKGRK